MPYPSKVNASKILQTAIEIFETEGWDGLSMRTLAKRLGLTVSSLYRYYPEKDSLEQAMAEVAARELRILLENLSLPEAASVYRTFANSRPALFSLLFKPNCPRQGEPFKELWNIFLRVVSTVTETPDDTDAAVAVWSFLHGFAVLEQSGQFGPSGPKEGFERGVAALLKGLK